MTGQLDLFTSSRREPTADTAPSTGQPSVASAPDASGKPTSRPEPHDHAGQPGDDGSLHYMLTGQREPPRKAA